MIRLSDSGTFTFMERNSSGAGSDGGPDFTLTFECGGLGVVLWCTGELPPEELPDL